MTTLLPNLTSDEEEFQPGPEIHHLLIRAQAAEALLATLTIRHEGLELDRIAHICRFEGRVCPLTRLEYRLLEFLLLNRGRVWSREELAEQVWQKEPSGLHSVAVYINALRRKLWPGLVRTVHGEGYIVDPEKPSPVTVKGYSPIRDAEWGRL